MIFLVETEGVACKPFNVRLQAGNRTGNLTS